MKGDRREDLPPAGRRGGSSLGALAIGALGSVAAAALLKARPPGGVERWTRTNHAGRAVTLFEGPAYATAAVAGALAGGAGAPAAVAGLGAAAFGALDDLAGDGSSKGLRGHLAAAARGEVTTGAIKILGLGATGLLSAWMIDRPRATGSGSGISPGRNPVVATLVGGAVIAGSANIVNLLDLRPGRALKVVLLIAAPFLAGGQGPSLPPATSAATARGAAREGAGAPARAAAAAEVAAAGAAAGGSDAGAAAGAVAGSVSRAAAGVAAAAAAGAAIGLLPDDLAGRSMLGDTGANSAGALLGTALVARTGPRGRVLALAAVTFLTLASERVSFTKVIESTPGLRELDALGRPPAGPLMPSRSDPVGQ